MLSDKLRSATAVSERPAPTFISSGINRATSGGANTISAPSGIQDLDLLVAVGFNAGASSSISLPSGFSLISYDANATNSFFIATKTASSEPASYTFTWSVSAATAVAILVYRDATKINTIGGVTRATSGILTASSITPTYPGILIAAFMRETAASISSGPSGMTVRASQTSLAPMLALYDKSQTATVTGSQSLTNSTGGTSDALSILFHVTNEPNVTPELVATASTQNASTGSSLVISKPTGTAQNDLMVAVMTSSASATWTGDTGWTEVGDQGAAPSLRIAYKVAGASEGSSYTFTSSTSITTLAGCILTYRYASYDIIAGSFTTATDPLNLTSITPTASQSILIAAGARSGTSVTLGTPTGMTARVTENDASTPSYIVCDQVVPNGPTGTRSMSTGSSTNVSGIMLSIKPTRNL